MITATDCVLVMGVRGCGKSYLAKSLQSAWPRRIIFDTLLEYSESENIVFSFKDFCERLKFLKDSNAESFELVYQFNPEVTASDAEFNEAMRLIYYFGNCLVVIEEVQNFSNAHQLPHWLRQNLLTGRHQGIALMFTTQRPAEVHKTIFSQCRHIFCGRVVEGNDVRYLSTTFRQSVDSLVSLKDRTFLHFSPYGVKTISTET